MRYICALTIAGSDSCGGAGVQADMKTMSALGVYAASAVTAITVQNTQGVQAIQSVAPDIVGGQIRAVIDDLKPRAIKVGMVNDPSTIQAIPTRCDFIHTHCLLSIQSWCRPVDICSCSRMRSMCSALNSCLWQLC